MANHCIPLYRPGADITAQTTAAVTGKTFVDVSGPVNPVDGTLLRVAPCAAGAKALGVAVRDAANGARVAVITGSGHVVPVTCAAAITAGQEIEVGAGGKAAVLASGKAVGRAWSTTTAANADVFGELY